MNQCTRVSLSCSMPVFDTCRHQKGEDTGFSDVLERLPCACLKWILGVGRDTRPLTIQGIGIIDDQHHEKHAPRSRALEQHIACVIFFMCHFRFPLQADEDL